MAARGGSGLTLEGVTETMLDITGYLMSTEFISVIAGFMTAILTGIVETLLTGMFVAA